MFVEFYVLLLVVEVDGLEALWEGDDLVHELFYRTAVGFAHCDLVKYKAELVLGPECTTCRPYLVIPHCEYHAILLNLIPFLYHLR